jgi:hypothetical protein
MTTELPVVLITAEAKAALEAKAKTPGIAGDILGGLLFGWPLDERRRLIVGSVRPRPEVGFGRKDFCLDQSRTLEQLAQVRKRHPETQYCGVWYVHHTPTGELTDEEWVTAKGVLEDPDYAFKDLVCLVVCLYAGELNTYALIFSLHHSVRGQLPVPTVLRMAPESYPAPAQPSAPPPPDSLPLPADWYKSPEVAKRLNLEHQQLLQKYRVEVARTPERQVVFRLMPKSKHEDMVFYVACEPGFPGKAPVAFLSLRGDRYPLLSPALSEWAAEGSLVELADDLVDWQVALLDQQIAAAEEALERGDRREASDLLAMVLLIDPRKAGAAHLLTRVQATKEPRAAEVTTVPSSAPPSPDWYTSPEVAKRLTAERELLVQKYRVESSLNAEGRIVFRLMPRGEHEDMVFYVACGSGFPDEAPVAFLSVRGDRYPLLSPSLNEWSAGKRLVDLADDLVAKLVSLLNEQVAAAEEALEHGDYQGASDLLAMVLLIDPRRSHAARLLAQAQSLLGSE